MTHSSRFEDRLLDQLHHVVIENPTPARVASNRPRRTRLALAGAGCTAALAAAAIVAGGGGATTSAYAVEVQAHGLVKVAIESMRDADGLQHSLEDAGIPAVVDYTPGGLAGCRGWQIAASFIVDKSSADSDPSKNAQFLLDPDEMGAGERLFIGTADGNWETVSISVSGQDPAVCGH